MKLLIVLSLLLSNVVAKADCDLLFKTENLCVDINWVDGPHYGKLSKFTITLKDTNQNLKDPKEEFSVKPWMIMENGHDHGGPKMTLEKVSAGVYKVDDARFMKMRGKWLILLQLQQGKVEELRYEVIFSEATN